MVELERAHGRHENILADLSNVESNINQLNKNITGLKRDADFKLKTNQLQITKMQNQEETLYDDKERQADQNSEYFDIKKGLTRNLKQIQLEHEELKLTKNFYEKETPFMQVIFKVFAIEQVLIKHIEDSSKSKLYFSFRDVLLEQCLERHDIQI